MSTVPPQISASTRTVTFARSVTARLQHAWLQDLADNSAAYGDDNLSILGSNPSELAGKHNASRASSPSP